MKDFIAKLFAVIGMVIFGIIFITLVAAPIYATAKDTNLGNYGWVVVDTVLFPVGIIRGIMMFWGWV